MAAAHSRNRTTTVLITEENQTVAALQPRATVLTVAAVTEEAATLQIIHITTAPLIAVALHTAAVHLIHREVTPVEGLTTEEDNV